MAVIGYIRVSSNKQTCEHQHYEIEQFAHQNNITVNRWVEETISSRKALNKRQLGQLLDELQPNDILIAAEISRLGRSLLEVMRILENCLNKNCQVWTIKENYRLGNDIQSKVMAFAFLYSLRDVKSRIMACRLVSVIFDIPLFNLSIITRPEGVSFVPALKSMENMAEGCTSRSE